MGNRTMYPGQSGGSVGRVYVEIKIQANGASLPKVLSGAGFLDPSTPLTHTGGTNIIGVKMRDQWPEIVAHAVDIRDDTPNGAYASLGTFANEGSTAASASGAAPPVTFNINTWSAAGAAANNFTGVIAVQLAIRNSSEAYGN
jgi:hypothetical protein